MSVVRSPCLSGFSLSSWVSSVQPLKDVRSSTGRAAFAISTCATVVPAVVTLALGATFLGRASLWTDEGATWINSTQPVAHIVRNSTHVDAMYLPYYLFMHLWLGVSQHLWWMRLPSLLAGAAAVAALGLLARRWMPPAWAILAGLLLALNPLFARWTMEARPYTAATLFAVLSTAALVTAIDRGGPLRWVGYGLATTCMVLAHLIAAFVLPAQIVGIALARRNDAWRGMVLTLACVAAVVSPLAVVAAGETDQVAWIPRPTLATFRQALIDISGGRAEGAVLVVCGIILAAIVASAAPRSEWAQGTAICLAWGAVPPLLLVLVSFLHPLYVDRYALPCLPGIALIEAMAGWRVWLILITLGRTRGIYGPGPQELAQLGRAGRLKHPPRWASVVASISCIAFLGLLVHHTSDVLKEPFYVDDFRSASATLSRDLLEHPAPVLIAPNSVAVSLSYYATPSLLADALKTQATRALNGGTIYWSPIALGTGGRDSLPHSGILAWPVAEKPATPALQCAVGWVVGRGTAPSKTFIVDGSRCRLTDVHYYGLTWISSVAG